MQDKCPEFRTSFWRNKVIDLSEQKRMGQFYGLARYQNSLVQAAAKLPGLLLGHGRQYLEASRTFGITKHDTVRSVGKAFLVCATPARF